MTFFSCELARNRPMSDTNRSSATTSFSDDVWVLPRAYTAAFPNGADDIDPRDSQVVVLHHFSGSWKLTQRPRRELSGHRIAYETVVPSAFGSPVSVLLPEDILEGNRHLRGKSVMVFVGKMALRNSYSGLEEEATLSSSGFWQGSVSLSGRGSLSNVFGSEILKHQQCAGKEKLIPRSCNSSAPGKRNLFFIEVGSSTGLYSLLFAKLGFSSLSIAPSLFAAKHITFSSTVSGAADSLSVTGPVNSDEALRNFLVSAQATNKKYIFHLQGQMGLNVLDSLLSMDLLRSTLLLTLLVPLDTSRATVMESFLRVSRHSRFTAWHAGEICRRIQGVTQKRKFHFLSTVVRRVFYSRSNLGPSMTVLSRPRFREPRCQLKKSTLRLMAYHFPENSWPRSSVQLELIVFHFRSS